MLLADFDFMGERARIDDLALTLHCARCDLDADGGPVGEHARLRRLAAGYDAALDLPLSAAERAALPVAIARQPLSSIGVWVARLDDQDAARRHAASAGGAAHHDRPRPLASRLRLNHRWGILPGASGRWLSSPAAPGAARPAGS